MRRRLSAAAATVVLAAATGWWFAPGAFAGAGDGPVPVARMSRFLAMGVLEGLLEDGVPTDIVDAVLEKDPKGGYRNFVQGCPVCAPVLEAFRCYAMRRGEAGWYYSSKGDPYAADPVGTTLPGELLSGLRAGSRETRLAAMERLVRRYVERRFALERLTGEERAAMEESLVLGRKRGMGFLKSADGAEKDRTGMSTCPSCDGANAW